MKGIERINPSGPIFIFSDDISWCKKNIDLNPILKKRIKLENTFISNSKKIVNKVHSSWNLSDDSKKHKVHLGTLKKTSKKIKKLDKVCSNVKKVDFIKIDVDGLELDILDGASMILRSSKLKLLPP